MRTRMAGTIAAMTCTLAFVTGCGPAGRTPHPAPPTSSVPSSATASAGPTTDAAPRGSDGSPAYDDGHAGQLLGDGLVVADGTRLAGPVGTTTAGAVTGWYAVVTVLGSSTVASAASAYADQLTAGGFEISTIGDDAGLSAFRPSGPERGASNGATPGTYVEVLPVAAAAGLPAHLEIVASTVPAG